jgi:hypothetical protein
MTLKSYRDLRVWQIGMDLVEDIYLTTKSFPPHETYALSNQMQRAAVSIPSNLAEGYTRQHRKSTSSTSPSLGHPLQSFTHNSKSPNGSHTWNLQRIIG